MRDDRVRIFFDGGCRPNPGLIEVAAVVAGTLHVRDDLGHGGNDEAEWLALIHAARIAVSLGVRHAEFVGDSWLVIRQAAGLQKCRSQTLRDHLAAFRIAAATIPRVRLRHVRRSRNLAGIALDARRR